MKLEEHQQIINQLASETIDGATRLSLLKQISDDYGVVQADIITTTKQVETITSERDKFATLSKQLWLENSAQTQTTQSTEPQTTEPQNVLPKRTFGDLENLF